MVHVDTKGLRQHVRFLMIRVTTHTHPSSTHTRKLTAGTRCICDTSTIIILTLRILSNTSSKSALLHGRIACTEILFIFFSAPTSVRDCYQATNKERRLLFNKFNLYCHSIKRRRDDTSRNNFHPASVRY